MVDWLPLKPLKDMRRVVEVMDRSSRMILEQKKAAIHSLDDTASYGTGEATNGDLGARMKGKDIMSIMRTLLRYVCYPFFV